MCSHCVSGSVEKLTSFTNLENHRELVIFPPGDSRGNTGSEELKNFLIDVKAGSKAGTGTNVLNNWAKP